MFERQHTLDTPMNDSIPITQANVQSRINRYRADSRTSDVVDWADELDIDDDEDHWLRNVSAFSRAVTALDYGSVGWRFETHQVTLFEKNI